MQQGAGRDTGRLIGDLDLGYQWTQVTARASFAPRDGAGALVFGDAMWLIGGWNPRDKVHFPRVCSNDVWRSTDGREWSQVKPNTYLDEAFDTKQDWAGRHTGGYAVHDRRMWLIGGDANQGYHQGDVWASADGRDWRCVVEEAPWAPRVLHGAASWMGRLWVWGGQTMPGYAGGSDHFYDDVWVSADGMDWTRLNPQKPGWAPRGMVGGSVVHRGRLWILGGGTYETPDTPDRTFRNDVWSTADGVRWKCHTPAAPWSPRQYHGTAVFDDRMWVLFGWNSRNLNDVWYSSDGITWREVPDTPWPARHAASVFVHHDALWVVAGSHMESDVWKLERG